MAEKEYTFSLTIHDRMRRRHWIERGKVRAFVVQYEMLLDDDWVPVVRFDTAHGFAHLDVLHPDGTATKTRLPGMSFREAYTFAQRELNREWPTHRERFLREKEEWK